MIRELTLRNFKCFAEQTVDLNWLTLLSGVNGMGKSSALQALLLLRQSHERGMLQTGELFLNGDLVSIGSASDALYEDAQDEVITIGIRELGGRSGSWTFSGPRDADVLELGRRTWEVSPEIYEADLFSRRFQYLRAERVGPRAAYPMSDDVVRRQTQVGVAGEYAAHYLLLHGTTEIPGPRMAHEASSSRQLRAQVEAWLGEISPGIRLSLGQYPGLNQVSVRYSFVHGVTQTNAYSATNVGFGISYVLSVLVALLAAENGSLVIVENPEAHLHPAGQTKLGEMMARAAAGGVQVIAETHSDHVLNGVRVAVRNGILPPQDTSISFFGPPARVDSNTPSVVSPVLDADGRFDVWPDGFFDEWDRNLEALLSTDRA